MDRDDAVSGTPADGPSTSGFQFNLDAALNELRRSRPPTLADLMRVGEDDSTSSHDDGSPAAGGDDAVPTIHEATSVENPPRPAATLATSWTASAPPPAPAPTTPAAATPSNTPSTLQPANGATGNAAPAPALPSVAAPAAGAVAVMDAPALPTMPSIPAVPAAPAYVPAPTPVPPTVGMPTAFVPGSVRTAAKRRKRRGGLKAFLLLVVIGGVVAAGLVYGRTYLFPDEWDRDLVPIADDIEATVGAEFVDAVRVAEAPVDEFDTRAAAALFGAEWDADVPLWRALGLASGDATATTFGPVLRSWSPAVYDPVAGEVVTIEDLGGSARTAALTEQLTAVLLEQLYDASLVVDPANPLAARAVVAHQVDLTADASTSATEPVLDRTQLDTMPSPLAHELLARADLGGPLAAAAGLTLAADDASELAELPGAVADLLGTAPEPGSAARVVTGDVIAGDPTVPSRDVWYLVFGAYLPADAAAAGSESIAKASLTPTTRGETACAYATLSGADPAAAGVLQFVVTAWVQSAPAESQAAMTTFEDGTVQLVACDPGPTPTVLPRPGVAAELVARQVALLNG